MRTDPLLLKPRHEVSKQRVDVRRGVPLDVDVARPVAGDVRGLAHAALVQGGLVADSSADGGGVEVVEGGG